MEEGLAAYREAVRQLAEIRFPEIGGWNGEDDEHGAASPWALVGEAVALAAYARHGPMEGADTGADLFELVRARAAALLGSERTHMDYPIAGVMLFALASWGVQHRGLDLELAAELLALAEGFGYSRFTPSLAWEVAAGPLQDAAPGVLFPSTAQVRRAPRTGPRRGRTTGDGLVAG